MERVDAPLTAGCTPGDDRDNRGCKTLVHPGNVLVPRMSPQTGHRA
jgi:hypothetical protein